MIWIDGGAILQLFEIFVYFLVGPKMTLFTF